MIMSLPETRTPGETSPSSSSLSYVPLRSPVQSSQFGFSKSSCVSRLAWTRIERRLHGGYTASQRVLRQQPRLDVDTGYNDNYGAFTVLSLALGARVVVCRSRCLAEGARW